VRTVVKPLLLKNIERAKGVDASDDSFVNLTENDGGISFEDKIKIQEEMFKESANINSLRNNLKYGILYMGAFIKENEELIGLIKIAGFYQDFYNEICYQKPTLGTHAKYHKNYQGLGYGTEVKKGLLGHYQKMKLIPHGLDDRESVPFQGFCGLVNLKNRSSLRYNIINCGYKVGRLFGDRVDIYYPYVSMSNGSKGNFYPAENENLHDSIKDTLAQYLSRGGSSYEAEEGLRRLL
jgi:hypothetical protein